MVKKAKNKVPVFLAIIFSIILIIFVIRILSSEDDWICRDGAWVAHGNPSAEMPSATCPEN